MSQRKESTPPKLASRDEAERANRGLEMAGFHQRFSLKQLPGKERVSTMRKALDLLEIFEKRAEKEAKRKPDGKPRFSGIFAHQLRAFFIPEAFAEENWRALKNTVEKHLRRFQIRKDTREE